MLGLLFVVSCGSSDSSAPTSIAPDARVVVDQSTNELVTASLPRDPSGGEANGDPGSPIPSSTPSAPPTTGAAMSTVVPLVSNNVVPVTPTVSSVPVEREIPVRIPCDAVPGASCAGADLRGQELMFANLQGADFSGATLNGADLSGADLSGANFSGANLTNANLSDAVLFGADFTGARLNMANLQFVLWDDSTVWPVGFTPPDF